MTDKTRTADFNNLQSTLKLHMALKTIINSKTQTLISSFRNGHCNTGYFVPYYGLIEWSLRAFTSMQAVSLFLQARAVIRFVLQEASAANTLENKDEKQQALHKFPTRHNLSFL